MFVQTKHFVGMVVCISWLYLNSFIVWSEQNDCCFVWIECNIIMFCPDKYFMYSCIYFWLP